MQTNQYNSSENAVDNGVELRIRRVVTDISKKGQFFEVGIRHWEPKDYSQPKEGTESIK